MKFSPVKYILTALAIIIATVLAFLVAREKIATYWGYLFYLIVPFGLTYLWYLTIPFGKAKEEAALERVLAQEGKDNP